MHTPINFFAASDIVVIGQNSEMADFDNPRGYIYGFAAYVIAEDERGNRVRWHIGTQHRESQIMPQAVAMAAALINRLANGKLPVAFEQWQDTFPAYGSDAYDPQEAIMWEHSLEGA